jgi:hypothetical protein
MMYHMQYIRKQIVLSLYSSTDLANGSARRPAAIAASVSRQASSAARPVMEDHPGIAAVCYTEPHDRICLP